MPGPPASRLTDMHACPAGGGPVLPACSPDVFINYLPAARVGDICADALGPPDIIIQGAVNVLINNRQAVRIGDLTTAGGVLVKGSPNVFIGGPYAGKCLHDAAQAGTPFISGVSA